MANILVIGPHPDDQEIGMGGTIARLASQGHDVLLVDMTDGSPTPHGDRASRLVEAATAVGELQPHASDSHAKRGMVRRVLLDLPNRTVVHSTEARHLLAGVIRAHQSQILFMPHPVDAHPDHIATTRIAEDARFDAKLTKIEMPPPPVQSDLPDSYRETRDSANKVLSALPRSGPPIYPRWVFYYYCSHLRRPVDPTFLFDTTGFGGQKRRAIGAYKSQFGVPAGQAGAGGTHPSAANNATLLDRVAEHDRLMGWYIGTETAEAFWTKEPMGISSFEALPL
ncbi:MAG: PIG-L family deacetylase [Phycisphaerales bacterium]